MFEISTANPQTFKNPSKACYTCNKSGGDDITCKFCGYKSCKDCTSKKRPFPGQLARDDGKVARGEICKVCERKFQLNIFLMTADPEINKNEEQIAH